MPKSVTAERKGGASLSGMVTTSRVQTQQARRLLRLMAHLKLDRPGFIRASGIDSSLVSRIINGQRAEKGASSKVALACLAKFGIAERYWSSPVDLDPKDCKISTPTPREEGEKNMGVMLSQRRLLPLMIARVAKLHGDPEAVVSQLISMEVPDDAPPETLIEWLFDRYMSIRSDTEAASRSRR